MKKLLGILAIASVLSLALMGCSPPAEGDTAPAPDAGKSDAPKTDVKPDSAKPDTATTTGN